MKKDIQTIEDIKILIDSFYKQVFEDPLIGHIFTTTIKVDWEKHLPLMYSFWDSILFNSGTYSGNPMIVHQRIHSIAHLTAEHFDRWIKLFVSTVDNLFQGEKSELAKQRAADIAAVMKIKILSNPLI